MGTRLLSGFLAVWFGKFAEPDQLIRDPNDIVLILERFQCRPKAKK